MELFRIDRSYIDNDFKIPSSEKYQDDNQTNGAAENCLAMDVLEHFDGDLHGYLSIILKLSLVIFLWDIEA